MKVKITKPIDVVSSDGKVYHFEPGEQAIHDSLLGTLVDKHLDALDPNNVTAMQDRILMVKGQDPSVNTSRSMGTFVNANDVEDMDDKLPEEKQVGLPSPTSEDSVIPKDQATEVDEAGNVLNKKATVTTPAVGLGAAKSESVGKANPRLISTQDTVSAKVDQAAQSQKKSGGNGNGEKPSSTTSGGSTSSDTSGSEDSGANK